MSPDTEAGISEYANRHFVQAIPRHVILAIDFFQQIAAGFEFSAETMRGCLGQLERFIDFGSADRLFSSSDGIEYIQNSMNS